MGIGGTGGGWLLLPPHACAEHWEDRGAEMLMVPLLPGEIEGLHARESVRADNSRDDTRLLQLVARGLSTKAIARELGISTRSVQRKLAELRNRCGLEDRADLSLFLSQRGF